MITVFHAYLKNDYRYYRPVAVVHTEDFEDAFQFTNHIDDDWTRHPIVFMLVPEARSTSVGDCMVRLEDEKAVKVESFGTSAIEYKNLLSRIDISD